jgi:Ran-binding protein 3
VYATGGVHAFATAHKRSGSGSPALGESGAEAGPSALNSLAAGENESPEDSDNEKSVSFGERLRAGKDEEDQESDEKKLNLTEQDGKFVYVGCAL